MGNQFSFVSRNALIMIFKEILKKLLTFLWVSPFTWVREASSLLTTEVNDFSMEVENSVKVIEMAQFAIDILGGSFFSLKTLNDEIGLVSSISAAVFIIDWECSMVMALEDTLDDELKKKIRARLKLCESVNASRSNINAWFLRSLSIDNLKRLGSILIHSIRIAVFKDDNLKTDEIVSFCYTWIIEVLECLGQNQYLEQNLLDQLLSKGDTWPLWITPNFSMPNLTIENVSVDKYVSNISSFKFSIIFF